MTISTAPFDVEAYAKLSAAGVFVKNVAEALEPIGTRMDSDAFDEAVRERWGEDAQDVDRYEGLAREERLRAAAAVR